MHFQYSKSRREPEESHVREGQLSLPLTRADIDLIDNGLTPKNRYTLLESILTECSLQATSLLHERAET